MECDKDIKGNENHYFDDDTIVGKMIIEKVKDYRKRRRGITPKEFHEILHDIANAAMQYH